MESCTHTKGLHKRKTLLGEHPAGSPSEQIRDSCEYYGLYHPSVWLVQPKTTSGASPTLPDGLAVGCVTVFTSIHPLWKGRPGFDFFSAKWPTLQSPRGIALSPREHSFGLVSKSLQIITYSPRRPPCDGLAQSQKQNVEQEQLGSDADGRASAPESGGGWEGLSIRTVLE